METLINWFQSYSLPVAVLLILGTVLVFVLKLVTERAVEAQIDRLSKQVDLRLERRSRFEERVLLDRYSAAGKVFARIEHISTDVNRHLHGHTVEGLFRENELVPLSSVYEALDAQRYLLGEELYMILRHQANELLTLVNAQTPTDQADSVKRYAQQRMEFNNKMNRIFGIERIAWS